MSTNDQPHAEVTKEIHDFVNTIRCQFPVGFTFSAACQFAADFCAARESLITASNEDLAAQVVKLTERAELADAALLEIKQRVTADEDFSADEIIELINGLLGRNAMSKAWCMEAAHKETMQENDNLRELGKTLATAIENFWNTGQSLGVLKSALADARNAGLLP